MALDRAKQAIFADWAQHGATEEERVKGQWQLDDLAARQSQQTGAASSASGSSAAGTSMGGSLAAASSASGSSAAGTSMGGSSAAGSSAPCSSAAVASPAGSSLAAYAGTYEGGLEFYVDHGDLYCKNAERGGDVFKLIFISGDKFVLDENVHVVFKKDEKGAYHEIEMLWSDGRVSTKTIAAGN